MLFRHVGNAAAFHRYRLFANCPLGSPGEDAIPVIQALHMRERLLFRQCQHFTVYGQNCMQRIGGIQRFPPTITYLIVDSSQIDGCQLIFPMFLQRSPDTHIAIADQKTIAIVRNRLGLRERILNQPSHTQSSRR